MSFSLDNSLRTLQAGRDTDILVCQQVMEWTVSSSWEDVEEAEESGATVFYVGQFTDGEYGELYVGAEDRGRFSPSRIIADAFVIESRMAALCIEVDDLEFTHLCLMRLGFNDGWAASFDTGVDGVEDWFERIEDFPRSAKAEAAPLAICRASLLSCSILPHLSPA